MFASFRLRRVWRLIDGNRLSDADVNVTDVLEENELRDDVAVLPGRRVCDRPFFFEPPRHPIQRVVGQSVCVEALLALEVVTSPQF